MRQKEGKFCTNKLKGREYTMRQKGGKGVP